MKNNELKGLVRESLDVLYKYFGEAKVISCLSDYVESINNGIEECTITVAEDIDIEKIKLEKEMIEGYADQLKEEVDAYEEMLSTLENPETKEDISVKINNCVGLIPVSCLDVKICDYYNKWCHIGSGCEQTFREFVEEGIEQFDLYINTPLDGMTDEQFTTLVEKIDYMYVM